MEEWKYENFVSPPLMDITIRVPITTSNGNLTLTLKSSGKPQRRSLEGVDRKDHFLLEVVGKEIKFQMYAYSDEGSGSRSLISPKYFRTVWLVRDFFSPWYIIIFLTLSFHI